MKASNCPHRAFLDPLCAFADLLILATALRWEEVSDRLALRCSERALDFFERSWIIQNTPRMTATRRMPRRLGPAVGSAAKTIIL